MQISRQNLDAIASKYAIGNTITEDAFTSTSYGQSFGGNVRFTIDQKSGVDISSVSAYKSEKEVLLPAGTRFNV